MNFHRGVCEPAEPSRTLGFSEHYLYYFLLLGQGGFRCGEPHPAGWVTEPPAPTPILNRHHSLVPLLRTRHLSFGASSGAPFWRLSRLLTGAPQSSVFRATGAGSGPCCSGPWSTWTRHLEPHHPWDQWSHGRPRAPVPEGGALGARHHKSYLWKVLASTLMLFVQGLLSPF